MSCEHLTVDGKSVIICGLRRAKPKRCVFCGDAGTRECDYPIAPGKTCDATTCDAHRTIMGDNLDHCLGHSRAGKRYRVISGRHQGHIMLILGWDPRSHNYSAQCSCFAGGKLRPAQLHAIDFSAEVAA